MGGFPFGHHYPPLGWLLLAALIRAGVNAAAAVGLLGFTATLAYPLALYFALVRCGTRQGYAAMGAVLLSSVSPYNPFVGGYETFFSTGLVSQTLAMPLCVWLVVASMKNDNRWEMPIAAWLSMASHPQVATAALALLCVSAVATCRRQLAVNCAWTCVVGCIAGGALYGQGIATLDLPFGWPREIGWRQLGFPPARLQRWLLDGELLDSRRAPVMTALLAAASLVLLLDWRRSPSRALLVTIVASLLLAVSGRWLLSAGRLGATLLSFVQPLRAVSLVAPVAAVCIAVALDRSASHLEAALRHIGRAPVTPAVSAVLLGLTGTVATLGLPARTRDAAQLALLQRASASCGTLEHQVPGYDRDEVRTWVADLSGGRLWYDADQEHPLGRCLIRDGIDLASSVPIGMAAAVGAHVGVLARAAAHLDPTRAGSSARAEALGIGYLLLQHASTLPGWVVKNQSGSVQLLSQPAQVVGVGCIERRWSGSPDRIRARLERSLSEAHQLDEVLAPHAFIAIEYGPGEVTESAWPASGCAFAATQLNNVTLHDANISAEVESPTPVDVVFRMSAFPTWRVSLDGVDTGAPTLLAPGFFSVRVPPGQHHLVAKAGLLPHYASLVTLAALVTAALAACRGERLGSR